MVVFLRSILGRSEDDTPCGDEVVLLGEFGQCIGDLDRRALGLVRCTSKSSWLTCLCTPWTSEPPISRWSFTTIDDDGWVLRRKWRPIAATESGLNSTEDIVRYGIDLIGRCAGTLKESSGNDVNRDDRPGGVPDDDCDGRPVRRGMSWSTTVQLKRPMTSKRIVLIAPLRDHWGTVSFGNVASCEIALARAARTAIAGDCNIGTDGEGRT